MLGAVGMAIDSDFGFVFITYEASGNIQLIEATTMKDAGTTRAPDASDLAGIVYDHKNSLLYCVDRRTDNLYVYNWFPEIALLTHTPGSPFKLQNATAFGIALDEINGLLYVGNATNTVTVYSTSDWSLVDTITVSRIAISVAVDVTNGYLYTGGGYARNMFLTQYHLATGIETEIQVEPDAGVMGLAVDTDTSLVYMGTGMDAAPGGDNLLVYDPALNQIDIVTAIGNPTGLAIPGKDIGYNPLNLNKQVISGASGGTVFDEIKTVSAGDTYTYSISFDNNNDFTVTDVFITDTLPKEISFISADDDGVNGHYDPDTHSYVWSYQVLPPGSSTHLEITVKVDDEIKTDVIITNKVTINSNQTAPTTTSVDVITGNNGLNLEKSIIVPETVEGQVTQVEAGDTIIYTIEFDNKDNGFPVTDVSVVDHLPKEVTFVRATDDNGTGKYNSKEHTITWSYDSLPSGSVKHLEIEVSVMKDVVLGTIITNIVTIDSVDAPASSSRIDAVTYYKPLNITKTAVDEEGNEIIWVDPNERFTYQICFDNNNNDFKVTDVLIVDVLPDEVTFVDDGKATGNYDMKAHTYTWFYGPLGPGATDCLELVVDVHENTSLGTIIANSVIIDSNETLPATADVNIPVGDILLEVDSVSIVPHVLRRNGTSPNITAVVHFPEEITQNDIELNDLPELYYQDQLISIGSNPVPSGTENGPTITIYFNRAELMNALYGYKAFNLRVEGKIKFGQIYRTYFGDATINITRFAGD